MTKSEKFIPIGDAVSEKMNFAPLAHSLPQHLNSDGIRVNTKRLVGMMGMGGISHILVKNFEQDRVAGTPIITGHDSQGGAYAGSTFVKTIVNNIEVKSSGNKGSPENTLTVGVNIQKIAQKIGDNLRSHEAWAHEIDKIVLKGIRGAALKTLLKDNFRHELYPFYSNVLYASFLAIPPDSIGVGYMIFSRGVFCFVKEQVYKKQGKNIRHSIFPGPQVDRWAILQARSRTQHVVKGF